MASGRHHRGVNRRSLFTGIVRVGCLSAAVAAIPARAVVDSQPWVAGDQGGALAYRTDDRGNRIPDFSAAGYLGGGVPIPRVPARVAVTPVAGDNGPRIQAALDYVATLPPDSQGIRGAVLLRKGRFEIAGQLRLTAGGVVLRGEGDGADGTVLVAAGTGRRTLIVIQGRADLARGPERFAVAEAYGPVGVTTLKLASGAGLKAGQSVLIVRPSSKEWIHAVGMDRAPGPTPYYWRAGNVDSTWDRVITAVDGDRVTLDAPVTTALESAYGGATVVTYAWPGRIGQVGVENLRCESVFDPANLQDEEHAWNAIDLRAVRDGWVDHVTGIHFAGSLVDIGDDCKGITVADCTSLAPVSELAGYRRHTFHTSGQLTLFLRCRAQDGRHDFTTGYQTAGPTVFLECTADAAHDFSGSIGSWSSGILFDNVTIDAGALSLDNLETAEQGAGWAAANSVLWQCTASLITCRQPPTAQNWAIGVWGQYRGDGVWQKVNEFVRPQSLYRAQLVQRLGRGAEAALRATDFSDPAGGNAPTLEQAIPDLASRLARAPLPAGKPLALTNGWLTGGGALLTGAELEVNWWRGQLSPAQAGEEGPCLTRFVPGRSGPGLTDDLDALAQAMVQRHQVAIRHHYGLWYDRRRDDHERIRRIDADVWPPFYELPWARSGRGRAWNGLTLYDLSRYNPWYFGRLRQFADLGQRHGLVLVNEMYFQHNVLEAGAHWADFPWRPANCIQETGFPEPPPYEGSVRGDRSEGGKRIFMADAFYDVAHPVRRALHRAYIRQCLASLADEPNVIHTIGEEFTGPLPFVQFWLEVIAEWETETGRHPLICLSVTKDVQDAILADPQRSRLVSAIELKYWWQAKGGLFAPQGGQSLAPRQFERAWRGGRPTAETVAEMVAEYRRRFPDKAVLCPLREADGWATLAAGGSLPALPATVDARLLAALPRMQPYELAAGRPGRILTLAEPDRQAFAYLPAGGSVTLDLKAWAGSFTVHRVELPVGTLTAGGETVTGGGSATLTAPAGRPAAFWLTR